ncbi:MAG: FAD-dependent monooxygenase [Chitinophagales bacterium]|nr:FAD-dependent monooxygenase [Bacteroidota bacterium]MCB9256341.1 FAD-dependent monooxygenase [Chitinophagales bacterium]
MKKQNLVVVGAGLVGSLWACYLAKKGHQVKIFERRSDMRKTEMSAGKSINLAMSTRAWTAVEKLGLQDELLKIAIPMYGRMIHQEDLTLDFQAYGKEGQAIYSISRGDLNIALMQEADKNDHIEFHFDEKCSKVNLDKREIRFKNAKTGEESNYTADAIFGTDGAFSAVRYQMQKTNLFNYSQQYLEHGYKELSIPPKADGSHRLDKNALHIWPRKSFMLIALPNLDGSFTVTLFLQFKGEISFDRLNSDKEIMDFFTKFFPTALEHMPDLLKEFKENPSASLVTVKCSPWHYKNACLLGDAAHAVVPFYGQGMNAGFQDCHVLDELLDQNPDNSWEEVFEKFSTLHSENGAAIADLAIRNFIEMRDSTASDSFLLRKKLERYLMEAFPNRYLSQYQMVSFTNLPYAYALRKGDQQTAFAEKLVKEYPEESLWKEQAFLAKVEAWLNSLD